MNIEVLRYYLQLGLSPHRGCGERRLTIARSWGNPGGVEWGKSAFSGHCCAAARIRL